MKTIKTEKYVCEVCGEVYERKESAELCESRSVSQEKGVKVGDVILITGGEGSGEKAKVSSVSIASMGFGHYAYKKYWHTVVITANLFSFGSRVLTFDQYETLT